MNINNISSYYSKIYSGLYSNRKSSSSSNDLMSLMKQVDTVRSPSYQKQMKSEYEKLFSGDTIGSVASETKLSNVSKELSEAAASLSSISKKDIEDTEGLLKKVTDFTDKYNSTIDALKKSDSVDALSAGIKMSNSAKAFSGALSRIGIKVGADNKLSVNEDSLKAADKNVVSSMLTGNYSVIGKISGKAADISKAAANKAQVAAYTQNGTYANYSNLFVGSFFDSLM